MAECLKKHIITIVAISLIVVGIVVTVVVVVDGDKEETILTIIKNNSQLKRPNVKLNAEFEYVKMGNNMTGLIICDPFASSFHIQFMMNYGAYIDTISGISHLGEHMVFQSSKNYNSLYPIHNFVYSLKKSHLNAKTMGTSQMYYITLPFNLFYEKAMDRLADAFSYPLYSPDLIKNEIQAVNHEFYQRMTSEIVEIDIVRLLSNNQTLFNRMFCGNNETLIPSESEKISKILKGYHMIIKNPNNIFFILYSNKTMKESEEMPKNI